MAEQLLPGVCRASVQSLTSAGTKLDILYRILSMSQNWPSASVEAHLETEHGISVLTYGKLAVQEIISSVGDDRAGATAVFIGTTRDSFKGGWVCTLCKIPVSLLYLFVKGQTVTRLDYQAYSKLAIKTMADILRTAHEQFSRSDHKPEGVVVPTLIKCVVHHRLGTVPVGEPSIVIAVSSPHRKESFLACEYILEEVKSKAQIWKREFYEGEKEEEAVWKANHA